jgi:hypothetical protein
MWHPFAYQARRAPGRSRITRARRAALEHLEARALLSVAEFELSSLLPANGGDGSAGFVVDGIEAHGRLAAPSRSTRPVGDINQDGNDDFLLAASGTSAGESAQSRLFLVYGRPGGFPGGLDLRSLDGTTGYAIDGFHLYDLAGSSIGGRGDINHDGVTDLVIGAFRATPAPGREVAGQTLVLYGGLAHLDGLDLGDGTRDGRIAPASFDGTHGFTIDGTARDELSGTSTIIGDLNGDGIDDLAIGAPAGANKVSVVFGRDPTAGRSFPATFELSTLDGSNGFVIPALPDLVDGLATFGRVNGAGDVNRDGFADLVIGNSLADPSGRQGAGQAYVIFGRPSFPATFDLATLNGSNGFKVDGVAVADRVGADVDGPGDVNGDGYADVLIHANGVTGPGGTITGASYVIFGKATAFPATLSPPTLDGANGFVLRGVAKNTVNSTQEVSAAGDVNGDGYADVLIGSNDADPNGLADAGQSFLVYGGPRFPSAIDLASLLASNGGDGSVGFAINGSVAGGQAAYVAGLGDINGDGFDDVRVGYPTAAPGGLTNAGQVYVIYGKPSPARSTKFFVVNDGAADRTYEYTATSIAGEDYALNSGNTAPRGAASTAAGTTVWVVDANKKVYVYNTSGGLLGSWTAGTLASNATVEGIATNGTDIWIVDAKQDKVFLYTNAGLRSGSQNAASSFGLNSGNADPKDIVTDGTSLWVVNDSSTDKVFKYNLSGSLLGSWTITGAGTSPTGITLDPTGGGALWTVDGGTDRVYQFDNARGLTSGSLSPSASFALAAGNTNPQGIADPPVSPRGTSRAVIQTSGARPSGPLARTSAPASKAGRAAASALDLLVSPGGQDQVPLATVTARVVTRRARHASRT